MWLFPFSFVAVSVKICTRSNIYDWGVVWAIEQSQDYIQSAAAADASALKCVITVVSRLVTLDTVCGFPTEYLDLINFNYTLPCCTAYVRVCICVYLPRIFAAACCWCFSAVVCCYTVVCCCSCCCLLQFVIVCRVTKLVAVVHCIWFQCFISLDSNTICFQCTIPLSSTATLERRFFTYNNMSYTLVNHRHARSQGRRRPAAVKPPL